MVVRCADRKSQHRWSMRHSYKTIYLAASGVQCWMPKDHALHPGPLKAAVTTLLMANGTHWRRAHCATTDPAHPDPLPLLPADVVLSLVRSLASEPSRWLHVTQAPLQLRRPSVDERSTTTLGPARVVPPYFYSI